jgi:hypothetical protein
VTLDMIGDFKLTNAVTTGTVPGAFITVTDTSANSADWTNRSFYGIYLDHRKTGAANYVTSGTQTGLRALVVCSGGSVAGLIGIESVVGIGAASGAPSSSSVTGFKTVLNYGGATGSIGSLCHFRHRTW